MSRRALIVGAPLTIAIAAGGHLLTPPPALAVTYWQDSRNYGRWQCVYNGYGTVWGRDSRVQMAPMASTRRRETRACLVRSRQIYVNVIYTATITTIRRFRTGSPANAWECGWLVWHHQAEDKFYYFVPKADGWELGKAVPGGAYVWANDHRILATHSSPVFPIGKPVTVQVTIQGAEVTIHANGRQIVSYRDTASPYTLGRVGLYTEDAAVIFSDISMK